MATINKKLIHFRSLSDFETRLEAGDILVTSIVYIQDAKKIWTHGTYYDCNEVGDAYAEYTGTSTTVEVTTKYGYFPSTLVEGARVAVKFEGGLTYITTLNVNGTGAKNVYYKGSSLTSGMINRYNTYDFIFDGSYWRVIGVNTDTHYTAKNIVGASSTATTNAAATNGNVHLNVVENSTVRSSHIIKGENGVDVTSDSNGNITISGSGGSDITVDAALDSTSTNPVQNKVITEALNNTVQSEDLATVATSGSYNDLTDKPTIPAAVTESTVSGWGFTKNTGNYNKPEDGIPYEDLDEAVREGVDLAKTALQRETYTGTVTKVKVNGVEKSPTSGVVDVGSVVTSVKLNGTTYTPSSGLVDLGTIESGGSGYPLVQSIIDGTLNITLSPNTYYIFRNEVDPTLNITYNGNYQEETVEYVMEIRGIENVSISPIPYWPNDNFPVFSLDTTTIISIVGNHGLWATYPL